MSHWTPFDGHTYLNWPETLQFCKNVALAHPDWVQYTEIGQSLQGRPIVLLTIGQNDGQQSERPGFWLDGGTHASEWTGVMSALYSISRWVEALDQFATMVTDDLYQR